jgi:glyoxylase-like metal-dependent hydrolase (beta-lactamase superfamily II)
MTIDKKKPKIFELKPDIYKIQAVRPGSHVYLIKGQWKNVLVDTGMADSFPHLKQCLAEAGLEPDDIHLIILTHEHFDHIGATPLSFEKTIVAAHRLAANKIQLQDEFVMMNKYFNLPARPFHADIWLESDTVIELGNYRLQVLHTPGHCSGCICLYEPEHKILFTGDTVLAGGLLSDICPSGSISDYMNSLERLNSLIVEELYPGHGKISTTPKEDLQKAVKDARILLEDSKDLFAALDTKAIFERLFLAARKFTRPLKE